MGLSEAVWIKASRSNESGDACVELAKLSSVVAIRDSKDPEGPMLVVSGEGFRVLAEVLKDL
ncbi:DUF397 domain-containing protein [Actinomadura sp. WMMB 499]|uniref:DUF397 domain-containing protein n=1 Tax=Actinomadura sp. WMMB 499 TaxID=1219491 RepID=UPI00124627C7|nr:DUF397 domain-containing protein [Actinomadura sp. WMMB 499]QFG22074.1 DUF397 domain-containing protein [Actinomadura sp. WMMB 499]